MEGYEHNTAQRKPRQGRAARLVAACVVGVSPALAAVKSMTGGGRDETSVRVVKSDAGISANTAVPGNSGAWANDDARANAAARVLTASLEGPAANGDPLPALPKSRPAVDASAPVVSQGLDADGRLTLSVGRSRVLVTSNRLRNADRDGAAVTAGSADAVAALPVSPNSILVTGKKAGSTNLIVEDETGRRQVVEVMVEVDLEALKRQLKSLSPNGGIDVSDANGTIILRGHVPSLKAADQANQIATSFGAKVLNLLEVSGGQQVMLEVKFAEVSKSVASNLGVNFGYTDGKTFFGNNSGPTPFSVSGTDVSALGLAAGGVSPVVQLFGNAAFGRSALAYFINALRQNNLMRVLAEPNLIAISGEQASFLAGGEFPVPVTQGGSGAGGTAITVEYREFGIKLNFTPVVLGDGRIRLKVNPEVSDLDFSSAVQFNGFVVPGLTSRKVQTTIELAEGQTFAIAGLLDNTLTANASSIPGLGDLPVIGTLFRSVQYKRKQTELMVMVTPHLVEGLNPEQVTAAPGEHWRYPTEADLFISRDLGGEAPDTRGVPATQPSAPSGPPPRFHGQYGFAPAPAASPTAAARP